MSFRSRPQPTQALVHEGFKRLKLALNKSDRIAGIHALKETKKAQQKLTGSGQILKLFLRESLVNARLALPEVPRL